MKHPVRLIAGIAMCAASLFAAGLTGHAAPAPSELPEYSYHPMDPSFRNFYFADAVKYGQRWATARGLTARDIDPQTLHSSVIPYSELDAQGYPTSMAAGDIAYSKLDLGVRLYGYDLPDGSSGTYSEIYRNGIYTLTWEGDGEVEFIVNGSPSAANVVLLSEDLSGTVKTREYRYEFVGGSSLMYLKLSDNAGPNYVRNLHLWIPDPADPFGKSLAPAAGEPEPIFNPAYIDLLVEGGGGVIRHHFVQTATASPVEDWADQRPEDWIFQVSHYYKDYTAEGEWHFTDGQPVSRKSGVALEYCVEMSNATNLDCWLHIPHAATDDYIRTMAQMVRDRLNPNLRVWLEYSNEVWHSRGAGTPFNVQGNYAVDQAELRGLTANTDREKAARYSAQRLCEAVSIFKDEFASIGGEDRVLMVCAGFSADVNYGDVMLTEAHAYGPTLTPAVQPDMYALATYFGIDKEIFNNLTYEMVTDQYAGYYHAADLWLENIYSGAISINTGAGDYLVGGGFGPEHTAMAASHNLPIVAYEGGINMEITDQVKVNADWKINDTEGAQMAMARWGALKAAYILYPDDPSQASWFTPNLNRPDPNDPWDPHNYNHTENPYAWFIYALERHPIAYDIYRLHIELAESKGMICNSMFVPIRGASQYGQYGHINYLGQDPAQSTKWQVVSNFINEHATLNEIGESTGPGGVPQFDTQGNLPPALVGLPYSIDIIVSGGDGQLHIETIAPRMPLGFTLEQIDGTIYRISGTPTSTITGNTFDTAYVLLRVNDEDGDIAYQRYSFLVQPALPAELDENILQDSGFDGPKAATLGYFDLLTTDYADLGWVTNVNSRRTFNIFAATGGNPGSYCVVDDGVSTDLPASMYQIVADNKHSKGLGVFELSTYNSDSDISFAIWGFNGTATEVTAALSDSDFRTSALNPDGSIGGGTNLASGSLNGLDGATWSNEQFLVDFGSTGHDYIVVVFSVDGQQAPGAGLDNVTLRPPIPPRVMTLVNGDFSAPVAGTLKYTEPLTTSHTSLGWYENINSGRALAISNGQLILSASGSNPQESVLQLFHDQKQAAGPGLLRLDALTIDSRIRYGVYGYNGTPAEVDAALASDGLYTRNQAPLVTYAGDTLTAGQFTDFSETGSWEIELDFGSGYDYIVVAISKADFATTVDLPVADNLVLIDGGAGSGARSTIFEGEDYTAQSGCTVGIRGSAYFLDFGYNNSWAEWNDIQGNAGNVTLQFVYANGSTSNYPCEMYLNGQLIQVLDFVPGGLWTNWVSIDVQLFLEAGTHTLRLVPVNGVGPDLDKIVMIEE